MDFRVVNARRLCAVVAMGAVVLVAGCGGVLKTQYEYEEEVYPSLDGSAIVYVNASVAALAALRGADLSLDPKARFDRERVRALFEAPGVLVRTPTASRRDGRRFVHVRLDVPHLQLLGGVKPLAWSTYALVRQGELMRFTQTIGAATGRPVGDVGWTGAELVAFRMHLPSRIEFHNSPTGVERGNIVTWEQPLAARLTGDPLSLEVRMEPDSILYRTLILFAATAVAAFAFMGAIIWWFARRGRGTA